MACSSKLTARSYSHWYDSFNHRRMEASLTKAIKVLLLIVLLVVILYYGRPFLVPVVFAALLSMLLLPLCMKLQKIGVNKAVAVVVSILFFIAIMAVIITLLSWQVSNMADNATAIDQTLNEKVSRLREYISQTFGISVQKQQAMMQNKDFSFTAKVAGIASAVFSSLTTFLTNMLLVLIYIFLFMYYRTHLKNFVLQLVPDEKKQKTVAIMESSRKVAQEYITGLALMIVCLWVMYGIGFTIVGVKNPIFFAILCGMLEIVPFVGNLTGTSVTVLMTLAQGGSLTMALGVIITYSIVQFVQSYVIQPLIVGKQVNINPLFTIGGIVAGGFVWGIPGMILVIPVMGMAKILFDHIEPLKPYGFLMGEIKSKSAGGITSTFKKWFS